MTEPKELAKALLEAGADRAKLIAEFADAWYTDVGPQLLRTALSASGAMRRHIELTYSGWNDARDRVNANHRDFLGGWLPAAAKDARSEINRLFERSAAVLIKRAVDDVVASQDKQ